MHVLAPSIHRPALGFVLTGLTAPRSQRPWSRTVAAFNGKPKVVADTSDEDSYLPDDPLDLDEEIIYPSKIATKKLYEETAHRGAAHAHPEAVPGSHETPRLPKTEEEGDSKRAQNMMRAESNVMEMEGAETLKMEGGEFGARANSEMTPKTGPADTVDAHKPVNPEHMTTTGTPIFDHPVKDEVREQHIEDMMKEGTGSIYSIDQEQAKDVGESFNFKTGNSDQGYVSSTDTSDDDDLDAKRVLTDFQQKAARSMLPIDRLTRHIADVRQLHDAHHKNVKEKLQQKMGYVVFLRILETTMGRAALVGLPSTFVSELFYRQSVLSQMLGRWDGRHQVEASIPQAQNAAIMVIVAALTLTVLEALLKRKAPPAIWWHGLPPGVQLWTGRIAMGAFTAICLYETMHSNRPVFPFWFVF